MCFTSDRVARTMFLPGRLRPSSTLTRQAATVALAVTAFFPVATHAVDLTGRVTQAGGRPVAGALVTVFNTAKDQKETVYTALDGSYAISTPFEGQLTVRARAHMLQDASKSFMTTSTTTAATAAATTTTTSAKTRKPKPLGIDLQMAAHPDETASPPRRTSRRSSLKARPCAPLSSASAITAIRSAMR
jgi:hypothetical protein